MVAVNPTDRCHWVVPHTDENSGDTGKRSQRHRILTGNPESRKWRAKILLGTCWQTHRVANYLLTCAVCKPKNYIQLFEGTSLAVLELTKPFITEMCGTQ